MSEPKYTKGPWIALRDADGDSAIYKERNHQDLLIATTSGDDYVDEEEDTANARLIAKCPEMLEMLKKLVMCDCSFNPKGDFILRLPRSMESELIALIREAEGE